MSKPLDVARFALNHYQEQLDNRGKPRKKDEWTVFAAIVASSTPPCNKQQFVVSSATGSKCTTTGPQGWCLRDLHAEVLAKRGLQRVLWQEMNQLRRRDITVDASVATSLLEMTSTGSIRLKSNLKLHLYISDSPCGDASIYKLESGQINFTGSKLVIGSKDDSATASSNNNNIHQILETDTNQHKVGREGIQQLGALRTKAGRSNLPSHLRSTSMSCSDKIVWWNILGLQGSCIDLEQPIRLSSIIVSHDPSTTIVHQQEALERAICSRTKQAVAALENNACICRDYPDFIRQINECEFHIHVVDETFESGKAQMEHNANRGEDREEPEPNMRQGVIESDEAAGDDGKTSKKRKKDAADQPISRKRPRTSCTIASPCGFSINWNCRDHAKTEVVVGARGILQGKKPKTTGDYRRLASRLCRQNMCQLYNKQDGKISYREWKERTRTRQMQELRHAVLTSGPLAGWLESTQDFEIEQANSNQS